MLRDSTGSAAASLPPRATSLLPPRATRLHPEGVAEQGARTLSLSQASEGEDKSMIIQKELLEKPVAKAD